MNHHPNFTGGRNIAMKVPPHQWDATVQFYRDVLGLKLVVQEPTQPPSLCFEFGSNHLWIDRVDGLSQAEIWLEITTANLPAAAQHLKDSNVVRRDEIEPLGENFRGFWVSSPASIIHLVVDTEQSM